MPCETIDYSVAGNIGAGRAFCAGADLSAGAKTFDHAAPPRCASSSACPCE